MSYCPNCKCDACKTGKDAADEHRAAMAAEKARKAKAAEVRFWSKVGIVGKDDCWEWQGAMNPTGYGIFYYAGLNKNGMSSGYILAHRYSFYVANGYLPFEPDSCIMHACDNRACVNPGHLSEGTLRDNIEDMIRKGRNYSKKRLPVQ